MKSDPIRLEVFKHIFAAVAEEMGVVLKKTSYSPNIKERRDFSCAVFDAQGNMIAQAAHIPVHLGSMPLSVQAAIEKFQHSNAEESKVGISADGFLPGDMIIVNDPFQGGTHLPDITLVSPVFEKNIDRLVEPQKVDSLPNLIGFVASRAHHADVGGMSPGSMPIAREIYQEGLIIPPVKLFEGGRRNQAAWELILANVRTPEERSGDLWAQIGANARGTIRLSEIASVYGLDRVSFYMQELLSYTELMTRRLLEELPDGSYKYEDFLDDDGIEDQPVPISVSVTIDGDHAIVDFSGSAKQQLGSVNAVFAITLSAVYYVFRCLIGLVVPYN